MKLLPFVLALFALPYFTAAAPAKKPNFVVIVADDMGFSDPGCYGGEIKTPNLDQLAGNGLRFTRFYNTARCWPSRAAILTGYYAQQVRRDTLPGVKSGGGGIRPAWARLLPEYLQPLGYRSYHSGKWHVDGQPIKNGFEHSYALFDTDRYFNPRQHTLDSEPLPPVKPDCGYYCTTAIAQHAIDFLTEHQAAHRDQPFFLYLAFTSPHFPLHALPEDIALYRDRYQAGWDVMRQQRFGRMKNMGLIGGTLPPLDPAVWPDYNPSEAQLHEKVGPGEVGRAVPWDSLTDEQRKFQPIKMAIHAAMVHRMDIEIGRVIAQIKAAGSLDDTAVFFLSDNGSSSEQLIRGDGHDRSAPPGSAKTFLGIGPGWSSAANTPLRLYKSWVHEGGISTPLIVHWPNGIAARGELRHNTGHLIDLAPTILELAGGQWPATFDGHPVPPAPGKSLVPVFAKDGSVSHDFFWWFHDGNRAIRMGDWKLVADHQKPWELYDLSSDRSETLNLAASQPERAKQLEQAWTVHHNEFLTLATRDLPPAEKPKPSATPANKPEAGHAWQDLFDGKTLHGWKTADFREKGRITVTNGELRISRGEPAAGIVKDGEPPARMNYEIELEAMRTDGNDFFCGLTFPVNKDPCTLICGGWGGTLVGLSSIDDLDASENQTATVREFKEKTWYKIRLRVSKTHITVWIDDKEVIVQELAEHKISIRMEVKPCVPLGISTWNTGAAIRNVRLRKLES